MLTTGFAGVKRRDAQGIVLCLRLQRGVGVRGWGRDGLGTGRRGGGARARRAFMLPSLTAVLLDEPPQRRQRDRALEVEVELHLGEALKVGQ